MATGRYRHAGSDAQDHAADAPWQSAGKRSTTERIQRKATGTGGAPQGAAGAFGPVDAAESAAAPELSSGQSYLDSIIGGEQHADAVADAVVRGDSAEALLSAGPRGASAGVQRKAAPAAPDKPVAYDESKEPAQGIHSATSLNVAFFFTGGDAFGQAARLYVEEYYPDHLRFECRSFEHLFSILDTEVPKAVKAAHNDRGRVEEIIIVSHANAHGGMKIPLTDEQGSKKFTPWDVAQLQDETADPAKNLHAKFMAKREQAMGMIDRHTRISVRGCEIGKSPAAMEALRVMFGGEASVLAPTEFQGFQIEQVGKDHRLETWEAAHDWLVANAYISARDLAELTDAEMAKVRSKGEAAVLNARKAKYVRERFPDGIPSEFFVVGEANYKAFKSMDKHDKLGDKGEAVKTRPGSHIKPEERDPPYVVSESDVRHDDADVNKHWQRARPEPLEEIYSDRRTHAELIEAAEVMAAVKKPGWGGGFLRLYESWQLPDVANPGDPLDGERRQRKVTHEIRKTPAVFNNENLVWASRDEYEHPDKTRDSWHTQELRTHNQLKESFYKPGNTEGLDVYDSEHIDTVSPDMKGESKENGFEVIGDDRLVLWGFASNGSSMASKHGEALDTFVRQLGTNDLVTIAGHTDSVGEMVANLRLSRYRAENVAAAVTRRGVAQEQIKTEGKGPTVPLEAETNSDPLKNRDARAMNRRVEIQRTPGWMRPGH